MMFIVRTGGGVPEADGIAIKLRRQTPATVPDAAGKTDFFCDGEPDAMAALRAAGWQIVELRDGYYEDGRGSSGGGVAIWGQGRYWEIGEDPLTAKDAVGPATGTETATGEGEHVEVRRAIFGA